MDKPWLQHYMAGVPAEIDLDAYRSIVEVLESSCEKFSDLPAFENFGSRIDFQQLDRLSRDFAAALQARGLKRGDRIALMLPNILQYPVALFGALRAGLVVVNTNPLYTARELRHQLVDSGARAIVVVDNFAHVVAKVMDDAPLEHVFTTGVGDLLDFPRNLLVNAVLRYVKKAVPAYNIPVAERFTEVLSAGRRQPFQALSIEPDDLAFLQYTGGTTGVAKGAMLTHRNMVANMLQAKAWLGDLSDGKEIIVTALPLYHVFALTANCLVFMALGGKNLLITNPRDMPGFVKELRKHRFNCITGVNTLYAGLLNAPGFADLDFSSLRLSVGGGMAVQEAVSKRWQKVTGKPIVQGYGLTETSPVATSNLLDVTEFTGSIGLPLPSTEARIVDEAGRDVPTGERGEIVIRGPQVMEGYWQKPEETAAVMLDGGWLRTGDIGHIDEQGYIFIEDRKKDMILVSGFNVYPNEIESVAAEIDGVLEAAAIGQPDEKSGEVVKLYVVRRDESVTEEQIIEYCRQNLTGYKVPREVGFRDELPKSNVGKILRRALREEEAASVGAATTSPR
jgi:long-chain acyl-CoA synthetase